MYEGMIIGKIRVIVYRVLNLIRFPLFLRRYIKGFYNGVIMPYITPICLYTQAQLYSLYSKTILTSSHIIG